MSSVQGVLVEWDGKTLLQRGEYALCPGAGVWYGCTPNGHLASFANHEVTPGADGSITVSPSILVSNPDQERLWHGYLEAGVWRALYDDS